MMRPEFATHRLNERGMAKALQIGQAFSVLLDGLESMGPLQSREMEIVRAKLEEACFYAKKAMATRGENQVPFEGAK